MQQFVKTASSQGQPTTVVKTPPYKVYQKKKKSEELLLVYKIKKSSQNTKKNYLPSRSPDRLTGNITHTDKMLIATSKQMM